VRSSPQDEEEDEDSDEEDELPDVAKGASDEGAEEEEGGSSQAGERACRHSPILLLPFLGVNHLGADIPQTSQAARR